MPNPLLIPQYVTDALRKVRESAETNMYDRKKVIEILDEDGDSPAAVLWLSENKSLYVRALNTV